MELERIEGLLTQALGKSFPGDMNKQKIYRAGNRLNFSCPYCGDSTNHRKKRGNFYLDTLTYKCYNGGCGIFKDAFTLLRDFSLDLKIDQDEKNDILSIVQGGKDKRRKIYGDIDISLFFDTDFDKIVIPREDFVQNFGLQDVRGSKIEKYLLSRNQNPDDKFAWDEKDQRLYLFNLTKNNQILGLQFRNMKSSYGSKYYTYKLSGIWGKMYKSKDEEFIEEAKKIDPVSNVFNIGRITFDKPITIFEGPMDSWLWKNSVALCSVENKFPFEIENVQYWYDWDKAGRIKNGEMLSSGFSVFNWKKFLLDHNLPINRKWDLNDMVNYLRREQIKVRRFDQYFTSDILDLVDFIEG